MNQIQHTICLIWSGAGLAAAVAGLFAVGIKKQPFKETKWLFPWGIFVWGDAPIIGLFWSGAGIMSVWARSIDLFGLLFCLFWTVRSLGEMIYWLNQQFSNINRNPPEKLWGYSLFKNDSIWFVYQVFWQCSSVLFLIASLYFGHQWLMN